MQELNEKLINLNKEITLEMAKQVPNNEQQEQQNLITQQMLQNSQQHLLNHKRQMNIQMEDYYSLEKNQYETSLYVNRASLWLNIYIWFTVVLMYLVMQYVFEINISVNIILIVVCVLILIYFLPKVIT